MTDKQLLEVVSLTLRWGGIALAGAGFVIHFIASGK